MKPLLLLTLALSFALQTEYGKPDELKGLTKIFVDTGGDVKNRERLSKEIADSKIGVTLLDSEAGAEVIIDFGGGKTDRLRGSMSGGVGVLKTKRYNTGEGRVYVVNGEKRRVVMSYEGEETHAWEKKPATSFGRAFVKAWKQANGVK